MFTATDFKERAGERFTPLVRVSQRTGCFLKKLELIVYVHIAMVSFFKRYSYRLKNHSLGSEQIVECH